MNVIIEEVVSEFPVVITEEVIQIEISGSVSYFDLVEVSDNDFVGKDGYVPTVDELSGKITLQPSSSGPGAGVSSFNTRTGDVVPANGDYNTSQVTESTDKKYVTDAEKTKLSVLSGTNTGDETASSIINKIGDGTKINQSYLPSYVDDVLEFANLASFPVSGEVGKIYIAIDSSKQYRWSGSVYIQITNGLIASTNDVPEGTNLYFTTARVLATVLSGLSILTGGEIVSTDTVLQAFGKIQKQLNDLQNELDGKVSKSGDTMTGDLEFNISGYTAKIGYNSDNDQISLFDDTNNKIVYGGGFVVKDGVGGSNQIVTDYDKGIVSNTDYSANIDDLSYPQKIYVDSIIGNLHREEFTFSGSQTITLANNYGQVYSVEVQGQGALSTSQYDLVAPNQITINDTLDTGDYIVVIYSNTVTGLQPYYSQAEVDALITNDIKVWKSGIDGVTVANTLTITPTYTQLIPANTFESGDVVEVAFRSTSPGAKTSISNNYLYVNTTNDLVSGSPLQLGISASVATARTISLDRTLSIKVGGLKVINPSVSLATDKLITTSFTSSSMYLPAIDWTVDQYFIFAIGHTVADQTLIGDFYRIIKN